MTLDSSALLAILFAEPGYLDLVDRILEADVVRVGAPTLAETAIVLTARRTTGGTSDLDALLRELGVVVVPFSEAHHAEAVRAYRAFGRGRHRAALNFGDCLSYAVASLADDALLFVGNDFAKTDLRSA
jgi:ribonuclease VapC